MKYAYIYIYSIIYIYMYSNRFLKSYQPARLPRTHSVALARGFHQLTMKNPAASHMANQRKNKAKNHHLCFLNLVGGIPTPLKNMSSSVGMMTFPTEWKNQIHVPNHQPAFKTIRLDDSAN